MVNTTDHTKLSISEQQPDNKGLRTKIECDRKNSLLYWLCVVPDAQT